MQDTVQSRTWRVTTDFRPFDEHWGSSVAIITIQRDASEHDGARAPATANPGPCATPW